MVPSAPSPLLVGAFSAEFKKFVAQCLRKDASERPSVEALKGDAFLKGADFNVARSELKSLVAQRLKEQRSQSGVFRNQTFRKG